MKNCIERKKLFEFYNETLDKIEMLMVKKHLEECKHCQSLYIEIAYDISLIKDSLDFINPPIHEIPEFSIRPIKKLETQKTNYRKILSWAASICLIISISTLTIVKVNHNQKPVNDYEYFSYTPDMNDAWKDQSIVVTNFDKNGNPIGHQIIGNKN